MSELTITTGAKTFAAINLGSADLGHFDGDDLRPTGGNLYLSIDGVEYGSLWIHVDETGKPVISIGQYQDEAGEWVICGELDSPADYGDAIA